MEDDILNGERPRRVYRIAVSVLFFLQGLCFASWASRIPSIQENLRISNSLLGAILFSLPAGSMAALLVSGRLIGKYGSKTMSVLAIFIYALVLPLIGWAAHEWSLVFSLILFGMAGNMANIAINTQAIHVEMKYGKKIMASFHGLWSLAGFAAAGLGTYMIGNTVPPLQHFLLISIIICIVVLGISRLLYPDPKGVESSERLFVKPDKTLLKLGLLAFLCMICEGTMFDWSGIYFQKVVKADKEWIGAGYTAFMCAMASGRFVGDWVANQLKFRKTIFFSALLLTAGLSLAVALPDVLPAVIGFMLVGLGVSSMIPLIYSEAGRSKTVAPGMALTAVSSVGFFGFLIGPPLIGVISGAFGLRMALLLVAFIGVFIAFAVNRSGSATKGLVNRLGLILYVKFFVDVMDVLPYGSEADAELLRNFLV